MRTLIIAEAGVNHNGDITIAKQLIDVAVEAGADIVKFQTFKAHKLAAVSAKQAEYQTRNLGISESQVDMLKRLELKYEDHFQLVDYCHAKGIQFLSTAFDEESLNFLTKTLGQKLLKIPSGELTNAPLLLAHANTGLDIILSTGMATLSEIESALGVLAYGLTTPDKAPKKGSFEDAYNSEQGQKTLKDKVTILHCTTEYPAPFEDINLNAMQTIKDFFNLNVGYSDHSKGILVPIAATAMKAKIIEKHFTLDRSMEGPDHKASIEPKQLTEMIANIRNIETILGDGIKVPRPTEIKNIEVVRKSLVAAKDIPLGKVITEDCIEIKRPGNGISPFKYWDLIGTKATKNYKEDELL
jgi:N-acetylneuraminate synthase